MINLNGKACKSCGGTARAFILFADSDSNAKDCINGMALCDLCFQRCIDAATNELDGGPDEDVIYTDDINWCEI